MIEVGTAAADCTVHVLKSVSHVQVGCCTLPAIMLHGPLGCPRELGSKVRISGL